MNLLRFLIVASVFRSSIAPGVAKAVFNGSNNYGNISIGAIQMGDDLGNTISTSTIGTTSSKSKPKDTDIGSGPDKNLFVLGNGNIVNYGRIDAIRNHVGSSQTTDKSFYSPDVDYDEENSMKSTTVPAIESSATYNYH